MAPTIVAMAILVQLGTLVFSLLIVRRIQVPYGWFFFWFLALQIGLVTKRVLELLELCDLISIHEAVSACLMLLNTTSLLMSVASLWIGLIRVNERWPGVNQHIAHITNVALQSKYEKKNLTKLKALEVARNATKQRGT